MECFRNILRRSTNESKLKGILDGRAFQRYRNWNRFEEMCRRFRKVYKCSKYDGECVWDLLKFFRDVDLVHPPYKDADTESHPIHESTSPLLQILWEECPQLDISSQPHPCRDGITHRIISVNHD
ncbi:hypothetical protein ACE6H2_024991 [Prunus campanulata]